MARNYSSKLVSTKNQITHLDSTQSRCSEYLNTSDPEPLKIQPKAPRPLELPRDLLAITLRKCREESGKSIYRLAEDSDVPEVNIWKMERGERQNATRETLLLLSLAMVLDANQVDQVVEVANVILDAAGLRMLRAAWEPPEPECSRMNSDVGGKGKS